MLKEQKFDNINSEYHKNLYRLNKYFNYLYHDKIITAKLTDTTEFGRLLLKTREDEIIECDIREIKFII